MSDDKMKVQLDLNEASQKRLDENAEMQKILDSFTEAVEKLTPEEFEKMLKSGKFTLPDGTEITAIKMDVDPKETKH